MKSHKKTYSVPSLEELLRKKEITLQKFFTLVEVPHDSKHLSSSTKVFRNLRTALKGSLDGCKDAEYHCKRDNFNDVEECISDINSGLSDIDYHADELERIIDHWEVAYESLEKLLIEIIDKEEIDLTNYSEKITEAEIKSYNRSKIINKLLGK